ncbi:MAG: thiamine ABC transporter substrate binding subunit [Pseudomonadota bacterium]
MKSVMPSELKKCQALLEELQIKSQQKHLIFWPKINPELQSWNESASGYIHSFDLVEKYQDAQTDSPEAFLYSNSVESCNEFCRQYSGVLRKHEVMGIGFVLFFLGLFVGFMKFFLRGKKQGLICLSFVMICLTGKGVQAKSDQTLRVYAYDALTGRNSFGEYLSNKFFEKQGVKVQFISFGTAGEALNQILLEGSKTKADLLMGIDEVIFRKVEKQGLFQKLDPTVFKNLEPSLKKEPFGAFAPFDYGFLAFVFDESRTSVPPKISLEAFPEFLKDKQKVIIQDPRTSSLGLEFLVWTFEKLGDGSKRFWASLAPHILTVSPGWSGAYELFLRKQADLVMSYTTSPAYHRMREKKQSIKPLVFEDGHFKQVEGICLLNSSARKDIALKFIQFVLSEEAQTELPTFQWMYPARLRIPLPLEFREIPVPKQIVLDWERVTTKKDQWVQDWALILSQNPK